MKGKFLGELKAAISSNNRNKMSSLFEKIQRAEEKGYELTDNEDYFWLILSDRVMNESQERGKDYDLYDNI